jgi:hypothetical protein
MSKPTSSPRQAKITEFFRPLKLSNAQKRAKRKLKKRISSQNESALIPKQGPATAKSSPYVPPHKRKTLDPSPAPKAKTHADSSKKIRPQANPAQAPKAKSQPEPSKESKKSQNIKDQSKTPSRTPSNEAILKALKSSSSPRFIFEKENRPMFKTLFPSTKKPEISLEFGNPVISRELFSKLLQSRLSAAHSVLESKGLNRPRLPQDFVKSQIHLIQSALRPRSKKDKAQKPVQTSSAAPKADSSASAKPRALQFVSASAELLPPPSLPAQPEDNKDVKYDTDSAKIHVNLKVARYLQYNVTDITLIDSYKAKVLTDTTLRLLIARSNTKLFDEPSSPIEEFIHTYAPHLSPMFENYRRARQIGQVAILATGIADFHASVVQHIHSLEATLSLILF